MSRWILQLWKFCQYTKCNRQPTGGLARRLCTLLLPPGLPNLCYLCSYFGLHLLCRHLAQIRAKRLPHLHRHGLWGQHGHAGFRHGGPTHHDIGWTPLHAHAAGHLLLVAPVRSRNPVRFRKWSGEDSPSWLADVHSVRWTPSIHERSLVGWQVRRHSPPSHGDDIPRLPVASPQRGRRLVTSERWWRNLRSRWSGLRDRIPSSKEGCKRLQARPFDCKLQEWQDRQGCLKPELQAAP